MSFKIKILFVLMFVSSVAFASENSRWEEANKAYTEGDYSAAIEGYNKILDSGLESDRLYYNLGNAYFKSNNISRAIINYNRALRLSPNDADIKYNLAIATAQTVNNIEQVPEFILYTWFKDFRTSFSTNSWAIFSIFAFLLVFAGVLGYLLANSVGKRKMWFSVTLVSLVIFIYTMSASIIIKRDITSSSQAVVISSAESVKSSPDNQGKDMFIINEGAEVRIVDELGDWYEITIASGNKGWIKASAIEII